MIFAELAPPSGQTPRQAALMLHAMQPTDRAWLLDQLPDEQRQTLQHLLEELTVLGIAPEPQLLQQALETKGQSPAQLQALSMLAPQQESDLTFLQALTQEDVIALAKLWRQEPAGLISNCLNLATWPWRSDLWAQLSPLKRRDVEAFERRNTMEAVGRMPDQALSRALLRVMRKHCERARVQALSVQNSQPRQISPAGAVLRRWTRVLREPSA